MSLASMLLTLPAGKTLLELEPGQYAPVESAVRNLRWQAINKANAAKECGRLDLAEEWQTVLAIAKVISRKFKRKTQQHEKAALTVELMNEMGVNGAPAPLNEYIGISAFQAPSATHKNCVVEASQLAFAPWINFGDLISVDFTATALSYDGIYIVAVDGRDITIRGFCQPTRNEWWEYENMLDQPTRLKLEGKLMPSNYEIVGRIVDIFRKNPVTKPVDGTKARSA